MLGLLRRTSIPACLLLVATAALVYGSKFHTFKITEQQEIERTIVIPSPFAGPGFGDPMAGPNGMGGPPMSAGPELTKKVKQTIVVASEEREPQLVREITFGGVIRLASGELRRTYTGTPPSLCPS